MLSLLQAEYKSPGAAKARAEARAKAEAEAKAAAKAKAEAEAKARAEAEAKAKAEAEQAASSKNVPQLNQPGKGKEALATIKRHLKALPGNPSLLALQCQAATQVFLELLAEAVSLKHDQQKMKSKMSEARNFGTEYDVPASQFEKLGQAGTQAFLDLLAEAESLKHDHAKMQSKVSQACNLGVQYNVPASQFKKLIAQVPDWSNPKVHNEWLRWAVETKSENFLLAIATSKGFKGTNVSTFLAQEIHKMAMVKGRSPRQGLMLLYLCVALSRSAEPLQLSTLGADTTAAITAAARMRVQDKDLQAKQFAAAKESAERSKTLKGFTPIGTRATRYFLEATILVAMCLLEDSEEPPSNDSPSATLHPSKLVQEVLLPPLQRGIQLQIDAARGCPDLLELVYTDKRGGHRKMYHATLKAIADGDFFKFNGVASEIATLSAKKLGDKSNFKQSSGSLFQFYRHAYSQEPVYRGFVKMLGEKTNAEEYVPARIKGAHRALEKMGLRSDGKQWLADNVCDGVRGALVYAEMRNMLTVLCLIASAAADSDMSNIGKSMGWDAEKAGIHEKIDVLRVKNRFAEPTSGGWADFMISFRFRSDPNQHVCELQLCHKDIMTVRKQMGAHHEYAEFRSALELLEVTGHVDRIAKIEAADPAIDVSQFKPAAVTTVGDSELEALKAQVTELKQQLVATNQKLVDTNQKLTTAKKDLTQKLAANTQELSD